MSQRPAWRRRLNARIYGKIVGRWRAGEGVPAHAGTLTVWTNRVGLNQDAFLRGVQSEIVKAA